MYEDVWRAGGASSLTFLSLPVALMWSHGDLAFFLLPSLQLENVKNFYESQSSQVVSRSIKTDFSLSFRFKASGTFQNEFKSMYVCVLLLPRPVKARFQTTGQIEYFCRFSSKSIILSETSLPTMVNLKPKTYCLLLQF